MSVVITKRSLSINPIDSVKYKGKPVTFRFDDKNETEQELTSLSNVGVNSYSLYVCSSKVPWTWY